MKTKLLGLLAFMSLLGFSPANADTIYTYTGNGFTSNSGSFTDADSVTGTIDLAIGLGDNSGLVEISPVSYSFSDGVQTLTNSNSSMSVSSYLITNAVGTPVLWDVLVRANDLSGEVSSTVQMYVQEDFVFAQQASYSFASNSDPGTWSTSVTATPLPAALPLFASGLGALGLLGWRRKRKAAALAA
jgi:hypothetical protein